MDADDRNDARQDLDGLRVPAGRRRPLFQVGVEVLRIGEGLVRGEDCLGVPGREVLAVLGGAGLHNHGVALGGPGHVQGALHLEMPAFMVDRVHAGTVGPHAGALVRHDGVVFPAVPELLRHVQELCGPLVPLRVRRLAGAGRSSGRRRHPLWSQRSSPPCRR